MSRKTIDPETRFEAVMSLLRGDDPVVVVARRHGMSEQTLYRLRNEFVAGGRNALRTKRQRRTENPYEKLKAELDERDKVIAEYTIANRLLKKKWEGMS
jgi:transposase-like protein